MKQFEAKSIADATDEEIRQYGKTFLGIVTDGLSDGEVLARVTAANEGTTIFVRSEPEASDQTGAPPPDLAGGGTGGLMGGLGRGDPKVSIILHAEERDGVVQTGHKAVGVNGVVWLIKRGVAVDIPMRVFEALKNAERDNITHDQEGNVIISKVKSTPYNVERMPSQAEIDEWHARVDQQELPA